MESMPPPPPSSKSRSQWIYDVFISFRTVDTRKNFVSHLYAALSNAGINTFLYDEKLPKGYTIGPEILRAIEESQILIVIFSKNYCSSTWCLDELARFHEWVPVSERCVVPIFYDVDPSEVRKQSGCYEKVFAEHEERFKNDFEMMKVKRWRSFDTSG